MNILLLSDDGPSSVGLQVLREAARVKWGAGSKLVSVVPRESVSGKSMSVTPNLKNLGQPYVEMEEVEPYLYVVDGTPVDCLYTAILFPHLVLGTDVFHAVLSGVNLGHNVGVDVLHSGTVSVAMLAATMFGIPSIAFSQEVDDMREASYDELNIRDNFRVAEQFTLKVLHTHGFAPGTCLNVNFPSDSPKGYRKVPPAPYSRWLPVKRDRDRMNDICAVEDGFIAISDLELSVAPAMNF